MAAPYSMDLRERVLKAWDASGDADDVAATFGVSRAWVHRLAQRHRETGSIAPRKPTKFRSRVLAGQEERLKALVHATPDATLAGAERRRGRQSFPELGTTVRPQPAWNARLGSHAL
jgi:transposase